ncbi:OprO/OprP family phosphate-selective porin [Aliifodinibius sp. S!AR15-10]|nr:OprO/OprP family phosphate-selective porin [Aliifodinibius sp. S!AR15-10]
MLAITPITRAQNGADEISDFQQLQNHFKNEYFSIGGLVQGVAEFQPERISGNNGFIVNYARLKVSGALDQTFGYKLQASITSSPAVVDANLYYKLSPNTKITVGFGKSPFSYEYLTSAGSIPFVERSTVVNQLAPKRQIGLQLDGRFAGGFLSYTAGIFNGNHFSINQNNDNHFLYIGNLEANLLPSSGSKSELLIGANISYEQKERPSASGNIQSTFEGEQTLLDSYLHLSKNKFSLTGELIYSWLQSDFGREFNPYGYYITAGYQISKKSKLRLRWDNFEGDLLAADSESVLVGLNISPSQYSKIKLNYSIPAQRSIDYSQLRAAFQVSF